jgi:UDP-N-acetyl-D-glucosamine dehydrogenase
MEDSYSLIESKIKSRDMTVTVMGLGYVGLPIALEFVKKGFDVRGLENNKRRLSKLREGVSYIEDIDDEAIKTAMKKGDFKVTSDVRTLAASDAVIVCVPTPLRKTKDPDISYILHAARSISANMRQGQLIIIESTTYPGTTRDVILPELRKSGFVEGSDFFLAFSPERIDPGNADYGLVNIPKVIGGLTEKGTRLGAELYSSIIKKVVSVPTAEIAEVTKLLENTFRIVNIALINEFAMLCRKLDINVWEVINAASTKPFGFMPFYPGPGIGGHCIPADPMYLSWKADTVGFKTRIIDLASEINRFMPEYVSQRARQILKVSGTKIRGAKVLISGVAYKKDVNDLRESPALEVIKSLRRSGVEISYHDPFIPYLDVHGIKNRSAALRPASLKDKDLVMVLTDHSCVDYGMLKRNSKRILDTRTVYDENEEKNIFTL